MNLTKSISTQERTITWESQLIRSSSKLQTDESQSTAYLKDMNSFNSNSTQKRHPNSLKRVVPINSKSISLKSRDSTRRLTDKFSVNSFSSHMLNHPDITNPSLIQSTVGEADGLLFNNGDSASSRKPYLAFGKNNFGGNLDTEEADLQNNIESTERVARRENSSAIDQVESLNEKKPTSRSTLRNGSIINSDYGQEYKGDNSYSKSVDRVDKNFSFCETYTDETKKNLRQEISALDENTTQEKISRQDTQQPFIAENRQIFRDNERENHTGLVITEPNHHENRASVLADNSENINEHMINLEQFYGPETMIYITKVIAYSIAILLCSGSLLLIILSRFIYVPLFMSLVAYLAFLLGTDVFWKIKILGTLYAQNDDVYQIGDSGAGLISLFIIFFKMINVLSTSFFAFLPSLFVIIIYFIFSKAPKNIKNRRLMLRTIILIQILLVGLNLDGTLGLEWQLVLIPTLIILGYLAVAHIVRLFSLFRQLSQNQTLGKGIKILGFFWYLSYFGTVLLGLVAVFGVAKAYNLSENFELLELISFIAMAMSTFLLAYTLIAWKSITRFIISFKLIRSYLAEHEATKPKDKIRTVNFEVEKKESYFVMMSPTYFQSLDNSFKSKGKSMQKSKSLLPSIKFAQMISNKFDTNTSNLSTGIQKSTTTQMLRQFSSSNFSNISIVNQKRNIKNNKSLGLIPSEIEKLRNEKQDNIKGERDFAYSMDDIKEFGNLNDNFASSKFHREENICHLCCTNPTDTILLGCGHGGICYVCATILVKKQAECLECRRKIEGIFKIEQTPKIMNIIKGVEFTKIIETYQ